MKNQWEKEDIAVWELKLTEDEWYERLKATPNAYSMCALIIVFILFTYSVFI